jgi:ribosomal-protein-alanine N-acetyltransferase
MIETNFTPFPTLKTDRLVLRQLELADDWANFKLRESDSVNKYLKGFRHSTIEQTQEFIRKIQSAVANNESIYWVMTLKETGQFIGTICLWNISREEDKAETGYTLLPDFQNKGYMNEALEMVIDYGFNFMKLKSIEAFTHRDNESSCKLLLKNKFILDPEREPADGGNEVVFILNR